MLRGEIIFVVVLAREMLFQTFYLYVDVCFQFEGNNHKTLFEIKVMFRENLKKIVTINVNMIRINLMTGLLVQVLFSKYVEVNSRNCVQHLFIRPEGQKL